MGGMRFIPERLMNYDHGDEYNNNTVTLIGQSKKVSLRVKINVYSAMVLSVLLHGAAESWALSRNQLSRLETLLNSWLRCITL